MPSIKSIIDAVNFFYSQMNLNCTVSENANVYFSSDADKNDLSTIARDFYNLRLSHLSLPDMVPYVTDLFQKGQLQTVFIDNMMVGYVLKNRFQISINPLY